MEHAWIVFASLTISEQMALASRVAWEQMALASLMVVKHKAWVSRLAWEQVALASLMDSVALDLFQWSSMPSSQMALHLWASMDALVVSSFSKALLAVAWSSIVTTGGVTLSDLEVTAMGEMLVGIPSRDASAISALTWDKVSTSWSSSFGWWEGGIRMTVGCDLLRVELLDPWPDVSSIAWDKRSLTSLVMLPSPSDFGRVDLWGLAITMVETLPRDSTFWSGSSTVGGGMSISS